MTDGRLKRYSQANHDRIATCEEWCKSEDVAEVERERDEYRNANGLLLQTREINRKRIKELEAEVAEFRKIWEDSIDEHNAVLKERDELRKEVERLKGEPNNEAEQKTLGEWYGKGVTRKEIQFPGCQCTYLPHELRSIATWMESHDPKGSEEQE